MLLTKLHIPLPGNNTVKRTELFEVLSSGMERKLILISAPAGFGKSTLISDWSFTNKIPTGWFSIDAGDNDLVRFTTYVIGAIQSIKKGFGLNCLALLKSPSLPSIESISALLINEILEMPDHFVLVFDDFHLISNPDIIKLVSHFLEHLPENIHLIILTRADPPLPVARLRSRNQMLELRSSDLSFSQIDIHSFFNKKLKLKLSKEEVISLYNKTEGWIAGLQLLSLSLQGRQEISKFLENFRGDNRYIMDYLIEEVLKVQPKEIEEFLLQTSILEQLSAPLCNSVLNRHDSQEILEKLEQSNMFIIPLDSERKWYRYHHLFARLLKQRLQVRNKEAVAELHRSAADWFYANSLPMAAIEHTLEAEDTEKCAILFATIIEGLWEDGNHSAIVRIGDLLPEELIKSRPEICVFYSWILITSGQTQKAAMYLEAAEENILSVLKNNVTTSEELTKYKKLFGKLAVTEGYKNTFLGQHGKIVQYCRTAMAGMTEEDGLWFSWGWYLRGMAHHAADNINDSIDDLKKALGYAQKSGNNYLISTIGISLSYCETRLGLFKESHKRCADLLAWLHDRGYSEITRSDWSFAVLYANMAAIEYFWADLDKALESIRIAYSLCKNEANIISKELVLLIYSVILFGRGEASESEKKLKELEDVIRMHTITPIIKAMYTAFKGALLVNQNQIEKARSFFDESGLDPGKDISYTEEHGYIPYVMLLIAEHNVDEAQKLLGKLNELAKAQNRVERLVEIEILYAIIFQIKGNKEQAVQRLIKSFEYARDNEIIMNHINYLDAIKDLLDDVFRIQKSGKTNIPDRLLEKLKVKIEHRKKQNKPGLAEGLSARELDTLKLLVLDLSNQEIADKLFVSLNTVKTHIKNIYSKLEVDSRKKAIEKCKQLQMV